MQQALIVIEIKLFSCAHFALLASSEREGAIGYLPQTGVRRTSCTRFHQAFQWNAHNRKASLTTTTTTTTQFSRLRVSPAHVCWKESNAAAARKGMAKLFVLLSKCTRGCPRVVATGCKVLHWAVGFSNTHTHAATFCGLSACGAEHVCFASVTAAGAAAATGHTFYNHLSAS